LLWRASARYSEEEEMRTDELSQQLEDLIPSIRARREEIEEARRMPRDLADDLRQTGIFSLSIPRAIGGQEAAPAEILRAIETVAAADGSTGWCAMIGVANNTSAGYLNEQGAKEVFADPNAPSAGIAAPVGEAVRVDGGVRVSGRWPYCSGVTHCDWLWAGCLVMQDGQPRMTPHGPEMVHVCVPMSQVQIHETWFVSGLSGTGSNDVSVTDVFVPEHRIFALFDPSGHRSEPLYRMPPFGWFVSQLVAVSFGIARGALDELIDLAQTKVPTLSTAVLADKPVAQIDLARAEAALASSRAFLYDSVEDLWQTVVAGKEPTLRQLALNRIAAANAAETGAAVTRTAHLLAGGSSIYNTSSLQRHMRDAEALTHHFTVAPHVWEDAGRIFLGRQPTAPLF
jgi:alkylation response protein AidB-like acyl-CoA dehydrogenase